MTPSKPDMGAAMELARDTVKFSDTMFPDKAMDTGTTNLARAYLAREEELHDTQMALSAVHDELRALQQTVDAGIVGMVPSGWVLVNVRLMTAASDGTTDSIWQAEMLPKVGPYRCVRGYGPTIEAAVRDAANKVTK